MRDQRILVVQVGDVWQATVRIHCHVAVGWFKPDIMSAIEDAREKFRKENPWVRIVFDGNHARDPVVNVAWQQPMTTKSETDLSDLFQ